MHLLYLDESGSVADPTQRHFVLAGLSVFERQTHWLEAGVNDIARRFNSMTPHACEIHGSPMRSGRSGWDKFPRADRTKAITDALGLLTSHKRTVRLFGVVVDKTALAGVDPVEYAFEKIAVSFDKFLMRLYRKHNDAQRGMIVFDKSSTELRIQSLARDFKHLGHQQGQTRNYAEVPVFLDSKASRLIQLADVVAYAIFRHYEHNDSTFFNVIQNTFDREGNAVHGFHEALAPKLTTP